MYLTFQSQHTQYMIPGTPPDRHTHTQGILTKQAPAYLLASEDECYHSSGIKVTRVSLSDIVNANNCSTNINRGDIILPVAWRTHLI